MVNWGGRTRRIGTFPVNRENIRVFAGGAENPLFLQKAGSQWPARGPLVAGLIRPADRRGSRYLNPKGIADQPNGSNRFLLPRPFSKSRIFI
jgi:hypothetical protein